MAAFVILALVTLERLGELWLAHHNTKALLQRGAVEHAAAHYPLIVLLHAAWLAGLYWFAPQATIHMVWLLVFCVLQGLRIWVLATLGPRWTTRIIVLPATPLVRTGPYRFMSHPNYVVVIGEIAVLPLVFGLSLYALIFSILNAGVLCIRIRAENAALARGV